MGAVPQALGIQAPLRCAGGSTHSRLISATWRVNGYLSCPKRASVTGRGLRTRPKDPPRGERSHNPLLLDRADVGGGLGQK